MSCLQRVGRSDRFATEPRFLTHDEHLNGARGVRLFIKRRNPGRFVNSAPEMPSSTKTEASSTVQPLALGEGAGVLESAARPSAARR